jgi:rare lipoprotein A
MYRVILLSLSLLFFSTTITQANVQASFYCCEFHGRKTASGERFNQWAMTAAHKFLKFGTKVRVTHKGKTVTVTINDRGPYVRGRTLDLSKGAARAIGCSGVCSVIMQVLG